MYGILELYFKIVYKRGAITKDFLILYFGFQARNLSLSVWLCTFYFFCVFKKPFGTIEGPPVKGKEIRLGFLQAAPSTLLALALNPSSSWNLANRYLCCNYFSRSPNQSPAKAGYDTGPWTGYWDLWDEARGSETIITSLPCFPHPSRNHQSLEGSLLWATNSEGLGLTRRVNSTDWERPFCQKLKWNKIRLNKTYPCLCGTLFPPFIL